MNKIPNSAINSDVKAKDGPGAAKKSDDENADKSSTPEFKEPKTSKKLPDAGHGNRFQSKLLMLYAMRAINAGYKFYLGTELADLGDKFDDLIFKYKEEKDTTVGRYHYLQAKHKLNENKSRQLIKANQLLCDSKDNNFYLQKYFLSYVKIKSRGDDIEHCIICTNVDFYHGDLIKNDILLLGIKKENWPKILDCADEKPQQACYKFKVTKELGNHMPNDARINDFFDKLIFVVKTPNESELDSILAKEVGTIFHLSNAVLPTAYIMNEMVNWFKHQDKQHYWLTPKKAKHTFTRKAEEVLALHHTTFLSIDYQDQLSKNLEFNDSVIDHLTQELKSFWKSSSSEKIKHISSETPKLTAVKVISAIKKLPDFPNKDDYLAISSKRLEEDRKKIKKALKVKTCNHLLVVVSEDEKSMRQDGDYQNFIPKNGKNKIILISNQCYNKGKSLGDTIAIGDLSDSTKELLISKRISLQGTTHTVSDLIDLSKTDKAVVSNLIQSLLQMADDEIIEIPSFSSSSFEKSPYIKRRFAFPSHTELIKELAKQMKCSIKELINNKCKVGSTGKIECHVQDEEEKKIWEVILTQKYASDNSMSDIVPEEKVIDPSNKKRVLIMGVAGTGKSTILSHYYKEIKRRYSDWWVIKINLVDHTSTLNKIDLKEDEDPIANFFINCNVIGIDPSSFSQLLLKHRLRTGDRIVLMLDGFDEISDVCQCKVIQLVKNVNESIPLYITTRSHMADELQRQLSQLAYSLVKFTEKDQTDYLTSIWKRYLKKEEIVYGEEVIQSFAKDLIGKVSRSLQDRERDFIGIPLQCRILAEYFQSKIKEEIEKQQKNKIEGNAESSPVFSNLLEGQKFDLASLYKMLFERKRQVFLDEKIKDKIATQTIFDNSDLKNFNDEIESHLRQLAIKTMLTEEEVKIFSLQLASQNLRERKKKTI